MAAPEGLLGPTAAAGAAPAAAEAPAAAAAAAAAAALFVAAEDVLEAWEDAARGGLVADYVKAVETAQQLQQQRQQLLQQQQLLQELDGLLLPVDVHFKDQRGNTALHYAAANGHEDLVAFLLNKGERRWTSKETERDRKRQKETERTETAIPAKIEQETPASSQSVRGLLTYVAAGETETSMVSVFASLFLLCGTQEPV